MCEPTHRNLGGGRQTEVEVPRRPKATVIPVKQPAALEVKAAPTAPRKASFEERYAARIAEIRSAIQLLNLDSTDSAVLAQADTAERSIELAIDSGEESGLEAAERAVTEARARIGQLVKAAAVVRPAPQPKPVLTPVVAAIPTPAPTPEARLQTELAPGSRVSFKINNAQKQKARSKQGHDVAIKGGHALRLEVKGDTLHVTVVRLNVPMSEAMLTAAVQTWLNA